MIKKQEELNRKAEELDRRERELQHAALGGTTSKWVLSNRGMLRSFQTEWNGICFVTALDFDCHFLNLGKNVSDFIRE